MKVAVLFSGGKDSNYALYWAINQGWEVECLVSLKSEREDSFMFHVPCIELTNLQAYCTGIPLVEEKVSGVKEEEVKELERVLSRLEVDGVVSGAVASEYQKTRVDTVCHNLGFKDILYAGFKAMVVGISAYGLDEKWLGRVITDKDVSALMELEKKFGVNVCGEGGEFETLVLDGPTFRKRIVLTETRKVWGGQAGRLNILKAEVRDKS